jgi:hypothetical protein
MTPLLSVDPRGWASIASPATRDRLAGCAAGRSCGGACGANAFGSKLPSIGVPAYRAAADRPTSRSPNAMPTWLPGCANCRAGHAATAGTTRRTGPLPEIRPPPRQHPFLRAVLFALAARVEVSRLSVQRGVDTSKAVPVNLSYLICTTPRSGSNFLCEVLRGTGVAGQPDEYFWTLLSGKRGGASPSFPATFVACYSKARVPTASSAPN